MNLEYLQKQVNDYLQTLDAAAAVREHPLYDGPVEAIMGKMHHHLARKSVGPELLSYGFNIEVSADCVEIHFTDATRLLYLPAQQTLDTHPFPRYAMLTLRLPTQEEALAAGSQPNTPAKEILDGFVQYASQWVRPLDPSPYLTRIGVLMVDAFFGTSGHGFKLLETSSGAADSVDDAYRFKAVGGGIRVDWEFYQQVLMDVHEYWERAKFRPPESRRKQL